MFAPAAVAIASARPTLHHLPGGTAEKYSNPAAQHPPYPTNQDLRAAPTTSIDRHATRSHRRGHQSHGQAPELVCVKSPNLFSSRRRLNNGQLSSWLLLIVPSATRSCKSEATRSCKSDSPSLSRRSRTYCAILNTAGRQAGKVPCLDLSLDGLGHVAHVEREQPIHLRTCCVFRVGGEGGFDFGKPGSLTPAPG